MGHAIVAGGARATVPSAGILLGDIAVGSIVKLNENGSPVEFYVAKHDYESGLNGAGRTLLVRKDGYDLRQWNSSKNNKYETSTIDSWLNGDYKSLLDESTKTAIGKTKFYYSVGGTRTVSTLERSVFLLSIRELNDTVSNFNNEGSPLDSGIRNLLNILYVNGNTAGQLTRTPSNVTTTTIYIISFNGNVSNEYPTTKFGSRPCVTLPAKALFDAETMLFNGKVVS